MKDGRLRLCVFSVGPLHCGVDVDLIHEVVRPQRMTNVSLAPSVVAGLINLRGRIVTALDTRIRLGLGLRGPQDPVANLVVRTCEGPISLLVDDVDDVIDVPRAKMEEPPSSLKGPLKEVVTGMHKTESALVLMLDVDRVVQIESHLDFNGSAL